MDAKHAQIQSVHLKQESDLKKQIGDLKGKLDSATYGRRAESEMYEEAMVKTQRMETTVNELNAKVFVYLTYRVGRTQIISPGYILLNLNKPFIRSALDKAFRRREYRTKRTAIQRSRTTYHQICG